MDKKIVNLERVQNTKEYVEDIIEEVAVTAKTKTSNKSFFDGLVFSLNDKNAFIDSDYQKRVCNKRPFYSLKYWRDGANCKLSYVSNIGYIINIDGITNKQKVELCNIIFGELLHVIFFSFSKVRYYNFFKKNFKMIYGAKIPLGYNGDFQWHVLILNPTKNNEYAERMKKEKVILETYEIP